MGDVTNQEAIKPAQTKLSIAFCVFTSALCEIVCPIWSCLLLLYKENRYGEQAMTSFYNVRSSLPALSNGWGYTHSRALAVSTAMCFSCGCSDPAWRSFSRMLRLAFPRTLVPLLPRHSEGCSPGVRKGICQGR